VTDPRSLSLALSHALARKIRLYEELNPEMARTLLLEALNLLPDYTVEETDRPHIVRISTTTGPSFPFNIQDAVDSLIILHKDYQRLASEKSSDQ